MSTAAPTANLRQRSDPAQVVTRFAPSPTGYLHVGGARTALFNWLLARHAGGQFLLRIEDTDLARSTEQATLQLLEDLRWLGLHWDNPQLVYQSRRQIVYDAAIGELINRGLAYKAYETLDELAAMRKEATLAKKQFVYRRGPVSQEQVAKYEAEGRSSVVRFCMPVKEYRFVDDVLGEIIQPPEEADDFVIRKSDGMPTYHFAVVVDDAEMAITHVLRGQEHVKNTFRHIALQDALGYPRPRYAHLSTILNPDDSKMGKRDKARAARNAVLHADLSFLSDDPTIDPPGEVIAEYFGVPVNAFDEFMAKESDDVEIAVRIARRLSLKLPEIDVHEFRKNGYLPEALLNFVALLGWSPGSDRERMTISEMAQLFSIERLGKTNPKFDRLKLLSFNTETAAAAAPDRLLAAFKDYLSVNPDSPLNQADDASLAKLLSMKKGFRLLREVDETGRFFFVPDERITYDPDAVEKVLRKGNNQGLNALRDVRGILAAATEWTAPSLEAAVKAYCERTGLGLGKVAQPIRVAVTGTTVSPPIFESLEFLGRQRTLARVDRCLAAATATA